MKMAMAGGSVTEMSFDEASEVEGGTLPYASFLLGCFGAGFNFGFNTLGPAIFG